MRVLPKVELIIFSFAVLKKSYETMTYFEIPDIYIIVRSKNKNKLSSRHQTKTIQVSIK